MTYLDGCYGLLALVAFVALLVWAAVATARHDRKQELDAYERLIGGGWG